MSQKPASVKSSPPWWLWAMLIVATLVIGAGVIFSSVPEDPKAIFKFAHDSLVQRSATQGEFTEALNKLKKYPEYSSHVVLLEGALAASQSRDPKALELFEKAAENPELKALAMQSIGRSRSRMGEFKKGIVAYEEAIGLSPETANETRVMLSRLYYLVGAKKLAEDVLMTVVETEPKNGDARLQLASICADFNRYDEAVDHMSHLLSTVGDFSAVSPEVITEYVESILKSGNKEKLQELTESYLDFIDEPSLRARVQVAAGMEEEARAFMEDSIAGQMATIELRLAYANMELKNGSNSRIENILGELLDGLPRHLEVWKSAAKMYEADEDAEKLSIAEENVRQLTDLESRYLNAALQIADDIDDIDGRIDVMNLLIEQGKTQEALGWYGTIKLLDPSQEMPTTDELQKKSQALGPIVPFASADKKPAETEKQDETEKQADQD